MSKREWIRGAHMLSHWFRKRNVTPHQSSPLLRTLSGLDLTLMGIGAIIGAGVFILTGVAAATKAGPGVTVSFIIAGLAALFAALSYAELASSIGGTGSAYSYAYAGLGEFVAWFIGWNLLLEYAISISTVAIGWSSYVNNLLQSLNIILPVSLIKNPFEGGVINVPAISIVILIAIMLSLGIKQSARFNAWIVAIKLFTIATFIAVASMHIQVKFWENFLPFGWQGVMQGASLIFFAYIGFDALSTAVEETKNPMRNVPIGIMCSLLVCTLIYIVVSALLTLIVPYQMLNVGSPVAYALLQIGYTKIAGLIAVGAIAGLTTVILVMFYGLTRILLAMCRDGLLPTRFAKINERHFSPIRIIIVSTIITSIIAGLTPIDRAAELANIGTLTAFVFVCAGIIIFRHTHPHLERPFRLPFSPFIPLLGVIFSIYLMLNLPLVTWIRFIAWSVVGVLVYVFYGQYNSLLGQKNKNASEN